MSGLYLLALLLTADSTKAEQCFVSGLEDCIASNRVFKEWAPSWARRSIIQSAIQMMQPTRERSGSVRAATGSDEVRIADRDANIAAVLQLTTFDRFVFVMSALEHYSDQDCKALLACSRQDILRARLQAWKQMATPAAQEQEAVVPEVILGTGALFMQRPLAAKTA
jgi:hypothetical protein